MCSTFTLAPPHSPGLLDSTNFRMSFPSNGKLECLQSAKNETSGTGSAFGQSLYIFPGISSLVGRKGHSSTFQFSILPGTECFHFSCVYADVCVYVMCKYLCLYAHISIHAYSLCLSIDRYICILVHVYIHLHYMHTVIGTHNITTH